jgi:hypothetical protein
VRCIFNHCHNTYSNLCKVFGGCPGYKHLQHWKKLVAGRARKTP